MPRREAQTTPPGVPGPRPASSRPGGVPGSNFPEPARLIKQRHWAACSASMHSNAAAERPARKKTMPGGPADQQFGVIVGLFFFAQHGRSAGRGSRIVFIISAPPSTPTARTPRALPARLHAEGTGKHFGENSVRNRRAPGHSGVRALRGLSPSISAGSAIHTRPGREIRRSAPPAFGERHNSIVGAPFDGRRSR